MCLSLCWSPVMAFTHHSRKAPTQERIRASVYIHKFTLEPCERDRALDIPLVAVTGGGQLDVLKCHSIIQPDTDED